MNAEYQGLRLMRRVLIAAGIYNLLWGLFAVLLPGRMLSALGVSAGAVGTSFWQCIGMIVGVYGVGYLIASRAPFRHWVIVLVGLLGKIFGPIGFAFSIADNTLPLTLGWTIVTNDLIWWVPFGMILWSAFRSHQTTGSAHEMSEADDPLRELRSNTGMRLSDLSADRPQLVLFLRHAGCTFCRQSLADLSAQRAEIERIGFGIVIVHMGDDMEKDTIFFERYNLDDVPRISDPKCRLYRQFGLDLGGFVELFGLRVWIRGLIAGLLRGHGIGAFRGNSFQMPGAYLFHEGQILGGYRHASASDRPDYVKLVQSVSVSREPAVAV